MATKKTKTKVSKAVVRDTAIVGFSADHDFIKRLDKAAGKKNVSRAKFVRQLVSDRI